MEENKKFIQEPSKIKGNVKEINQAYYGRSSKKKVDNILLLDREKQFITLQEFDNGGKILQHKLAKQNEDYSDIVKVAKLFAKQGKTVEIMPEIYKNERTIRNIIFPNLQSKTSNPDIKIGNKYYDVKRPTAIKNIEGNANKASKQGAIAVITDTRLNIELTERIMKIRSEHILKSSNYRFSSIVFMKGNKLYFY